MLLSEEHLHPAAPEHNTTFNKHEFIKCAFSSYYYYHYYHIQTSLWSAGGWRKCYDLQEVGPTRVPVKQTPVQVADGVCLFTAGDILNVGSQRGRSESDELSS